MCGIAGFVTPTGGRAAEMETLVGSMTDALAHRGPDDAATWVDAGAGVALGHRRLSIVDLSPAGRQPMASASGRHVITLNGEIYNFPSLRVELERLGATFRGRSDTEVLLAAIEQWGLTGALERSVGMWAFALWDSRERTLHLVRDRMGEKPLYFGWQRGTLLFSSELKAMRRHPSFSAGVDRGALALFARLGYVPPPWTIHDGIRMLEPGTVLSLTREDLAAGPAATVSPAPYWSVEAVARKGLASPFVGTEDEAADELEALLREAVRGQVIADVPHGAFLSGGIDSSTVVALMQAQSTQPVRTFCVGFHEAEHDESRHARAVARHLGTEHEDVVLTPEDMLGVIPSLPDLYDEPFADPSQVPTHLVSRLARRHVTVSLSGDGGDELFAGYDRYFWARRLQQVVGPLPSPARHALSSLITAVPERAWTAALGSLGGLLPAVARKAGAGAKVHRLARIARQASPRSSYRELVSLWSEPERLVLGASEPLTQLSARAGALPWSHLVDELRYLDMVTYLPGDILVKVDRAAMAVGLETRVPLLDHRVVELAWRLPPRMLIRNGRGKWLLRRVLARHVPPALTERPKAGFGVPIDRWLRGPLRAWAEDLLDAGRLRREGFFDPALVRAAWADHQSGRREHHYRLWTILMFQAWLARWER